MDPKDWRRPANTQPDVGARGGASEEAMFPTERGCDGQLRFIRLPNSMGYCIDAAPTSCLRKKLEKGTLRQNLLAIVQDGISHGWGQRLHRFKAPVRRSVTRVYVSQDNPATQSDTAKSGLFYANSVETIFSHGQGKLAASPRKKRSRLARISTQALLCDDTSSSGSGIFSKLCQRSRPKRHQIAGTTAVHLQQG